MEDASVDSLLVGAKAVAALLTAIGSFLIGRHHARTQASTARAASAHREREQLFNHYNELILATREMNHVLRNEMGEVRTQIVALQMYHQDTLSKAVEDLSEYRVENERLKSDMKHLRDDIKRLRERLKGHTDEAPKDD